MANNFSGSWFGAMTRQLKNWIIEMSHFRVFLEKKIEKKFEIFRMSTVAEIKLILCGDSAVGKSKLGEILTKNIFLIFFFKFLICQ